MARFRRLSDLNDPLPFVDPRWQYLLPEAPTAVTATAGNAQATVSWTAPDSIVDITDYYVQFQPSGGGWSTFSDGVSSGTSATVTGLTNGTAYQFRVAAVNGVGQGAWSTASAAATPQAGDPLFASVRGLFHFDGDFTDSSATGGTWSGTVAYSSSVKKFGSHSLSPNGGYMSRSSSAYNWGTGDFTIEAWVYPTASTGIYGIYATSGGADANPKFVVHLDALQPKVHISNLSGITNAWLSAGTTVPLNQWSHIAIVRSSETASWYINGTRTATASESANITFSGQPTYIGYGGEPYFASFAGYIDELRLSSIARYSGATITVPTSAFPEAVPGTDPYISNVSLLLHADGTGSTFVDSSPTPKTITAFGNATQSTTQSKWGGKSAYFSGSGDWLSFADLELGTGDFTIEMFFKTNSSVQYAQLIGNEVSGGSAGFSLLINNDSSTGGQIALYRGSLIVQSASGDWSDDAWHHIAVVRSGSTVTLYIDGTSYGSGTTSASFNGGNYYVAYNNEFGPRNLVGYIDDLRITKAARYTGSTITVPTAAFPDA